MPTRPALKVLAGMMPSLHAPGVIRPGQLPPINRTPPICLTSRTTFIMSSTGMPSAMLTINPTPACAASSVASGAADGGTKMMLAFSSGCANLASRTLS